MSSATGSSMFKQPKAVYAVAFACVVSFMGIGLVDPILPALSTQLHATPEPGQPAVHQLPRGDRGRDAVHRLGVQPDRRQAHADHRAGDHRRLLRARRAVRTPSAASSASGPAGAWATPCSSPRRWRSSSRSATRRFRRRDRPLRGRAGPRHRGRPAGRRPARRHQLAGTVLRRRRPDGHRARSPPSSCSTRRPSRRSRTSLTAPLKALRHRSLLTMSVTALLYNWGFFTMLGYAPYPMELDAIQLGFVFFGWGLLVAFFAVIGAPRLQAPVRHRPVALRRAGLLRRPAAAHRPVHRRPLGADRAASSPRASSSASTTR